MTGSARGRRGGAFGLAAALAVIAAGASLQCLDIFLPENPVSSFVREHVESRTVDLRFRLRGTIRPPGDIVIVAVDEESLGEIGRWPWPRKTVARLVDAIATAGPRVIGLDLFFPETESPEADGALGDAIERAGNVVMAAAFVREGDTRGFAAAGPLPPWLEDAAFTVVRNVGTKGLVRAGAVLPSRETIAAGALGHGHALAELDEDAMVRKELLALGYGLEVIPSFSLAVAARAEGIADELEYDALRGVVFGHRVIETDANGRVAINYYGAGGSFSQLSALDVLRGEVPAGALRDRIVYVGATGLQTYDPAPSPFDPRLPGVEKNATVTANILAGDFLGRGYGFLELGVIILGGMVLTLVLFRVRAATGALVAFSVVTLYLLLAWFAFGHLRYVVGVVYPTGTFVLVYAAVTVARFVTEERKAREIRALFQNYVSPKIVAELLKNPGQVRIGGIRREITVLFSDVQGFTTFSEVNEPEAVVERLNEVLGAMSEIIFRWDGTLDKFVGDEIMAFWGAPLEQPDHAERAVRCALDMAEKLEELGREWEAEGKTVLRMGIGINSGEAVVGNIGASGRKMDYTLIGDTVNTGARIESLTRRFGRDLLVAGTTVERVRCPDLDFTHLGDAPVKGKDKAVSVFGVRMQKDGGLVGEDP